MGRLTVLVFFVFCAFSNAQTGNYWNDLIPSGKEVDFNYEAILNAGISLPDDYSSLFHLRGVLHVQRDDEDELVLKLTNLNHTLDNGKVSEFPDKTPLKLGDHMNALTSPFKIIMNDDGIIHEVGFEETTPDFIRNIQLGVVNMFNVNWRIVLINSTKVHSFKGSEGHLWNVIPNGNILKIEALGTVIHDGSMENVESLRCDESFEEPLSKDLQIVYTVDRNLNLMKKIETSGGIYYHSFQGLTPAYNIYVTQTLSFLNVHDIETKMTFNKEIKDQSLLMVFNDHENLNLPLEIVTNKQTLIPVVEKLVHQLLEFIETRKVDLSMPDFEKAQIPTRLRNVLKHFDVNMLEDLLKTLITKGQKQADLFYQVLSHVGTYDSVKFLIDLIKTKRLNDFESIRALQRIPFHIIVNETMLDDFDVLLDLGNVSREVQNMANLCFGSLINRNHKFLRVGFKSQERYINKIINKLKSTNKIDVKYSYLNALYNAQPWFSTERLSELLNINDNEFRMKTLTSFHKTISHPYDIDTNMLPLLNDKTLPTDVRIIAFYTIMKSKPLLSQLINIYWIMQTESDIDLYQFYYTYMDSMSKSLNPCEKSMRLHATQMMKYMHRPYRHTLTEYKRIDNFNKEVNRGEYFDWFIVDSNESLMIHLAYGKTIMNMHMRPFSIYLRLSGLHGRLLNDLKLNVKKGMKLFNFDEVLRNLMMVLQQENVLLDVAYSENGRIVLADTINKSNFMEKKEFYVKYIDLSEKNEVELNFDFIYIINVPNNIGFRLSQRNNRVGMGRFPMNVDFNFNDNILTLNLNGKMDYTDYYVNGLYVHNPISQTWHGVGKSTVYDMVLPLSLDINLNTQQNLLKISWKKQKKEEDNVIATRSYVAHIVQNYDYLPTGNLLKMNPNVKEFVVLPTNLDVMNNHTIIETEDQNVGYKSRVIFFDTEDSKSMDDISPLRLEGLDVCSYLDHVLKHLQFDDDLLSVILEYSKVDNELEMMYKHGRRGALVLREPSKINPVTNIDLSVRLDHEITKDTPSVILPGMKIILKGSFSLKNEETLVKRWDANINWELNNGHTENSVKGQLVRTKPGETDYKICVEGLETYTGLEIIGSMNIKMSPSPDGTCKDDGGNIDIKMKGERLPEQIRGVYNFPWCHKHVFLQIPSKMPSHSCLSDRTSIRKYLFEIKSQNTPVGLQRFTQSLMEFLKVKYYDHYLIETSNESVKENTKIILTYPVSNDVLDMEMIKGNHRYRLSALPAANFRRYGFFIPDNLHYSNVQKWMHSIGMTSICTANSHDILNVNNTLLSDVITEDWVLIMGSSEENPDTGIWLKRVNNKLAMKLVHKVHITLVLPLENGKWSVTIDGKEIHNELIHTTEKLTLLTDGNWLTILIKECGTQLVYNTHEVLIEVPKLNMGTEKLSGRCL